MPLLRKINDAGQASLFVLERGDLLGGLFGVDHPGQDEEVFRRDLVIDPRAVGTQQVGQVVQLTFEQALAFLAIDHLGADLQRVDHVDAAVNVGIAVDRFVPGLPRAGERLDKQLADF